MAKVRRRKSEGAGKCNEWAVIQDEVSSCWEADGF